MMQIISHRGYWKTPSEKNGLTAFERSFSLGFGTETDFRDYNGQVVISHDVVNISVPSLEQFFEIYKQYSGDFPLAMNIKADGLQKLLKEAIVRFDVNNYFVFDMSVPDTLGYIDFGIDFFSRQSEYEPQPAFYDQCSGIWLDAFTDIWYDSGLILNHISKGKQVAIVSSELHKRAHIKLWEFIKANGLYKISQVILCTDLPEDAKHYFEIL
jgi:hypothetical protein